MVSQSPSMDSATNESWVRGHHIYKANWSPFKGEKLVCCQEKNKSHDPYAVEVPCVLHLQGRIKDIGKIVKLLCPDLPLNKKRKIDTSDPEAKCSEPHDEYNHKS